MPDGNQERFEEYLELEQFLMGLQAGRVVHAPKVLTPIQARVYRMALLFHAATPGASDLRGEFAAHLQARLAHELQEQTDKHRRSHPWLSPLSLPKRRVSRRRLLTGSAVVAASAAIGADLDHLAGQTRPVATPGAIHLAGSLKEWSFVTTVARLGNETVSFASEQLTGYVVRGERTHGDPTSPGQILALSAACTHMGCLVAWSGADRSFHCPCHDAVFTEDGRAKTSASDWPALPPLPRLDVKIEEGKIYVRVPPSAS